jgi:hypothetical protein
MRGAAARSFALLRLASGATVAELLSLDNTEPASHRTAISVAVIELLLYPSVKGPLIPSLAAMPAAGAAALAAHLTRTLSMHDARYGAVAAGAVHAVAAHRQRLGERTRRALRTQMCQETLARVAAQPETTRE